MSLLDSLIPIRKRKIYDNQQEDRANGISSFGLTYGFGGGGTLSQHRSLQLSTVYRCVEVISNGCAELPLEPYAVDTKGFKTKLTTHPIYHILNVCANKRMSRYRFIKTMVTSVLLNGEAYAYIERENGIVKALHYLPYEYVTIIPPKNLADPLTYTVTGLNGVVEDKDMLRFIGMSLDGVTGISVLQFAKRTLELANNSEAHASGFFKGGGNLSGILTVQSALTSKQAEQIKQSWHTAFSSEVGDPNGIAVLSGNMSFAPITVSPADCQLLESRNFNVIEICRFFGVSPTQVGDLTHSNFATSEAQQLAFLSNTLQPLLTNIEQEFDRKIFATEQEHLNIEIKFDVSELLKADKSAQASYFTQLFNIGCITPNEIRRELNLSPLESGDKTFVQVNITTLDRATSDNPLDEQVIKERLQDNQQSEEKE